ncbi:MAG: hypothetical protein ABIG84_05730 [archaeon]
MDMKLKDELDLLKKGVLSENQRKLDTPVGETLAKRRGSLLEPEKSSPDNLKLRNSLNRPSRREAYIVYYKLNDKSNVKKVQFSYALTGRTNQIGILQKLKGKKLGRGCLLIPAVNLNDIQEFFKYWNVGIAMQKILLVD